MGVLLHLLTNRGICLRGHLKFTSIGVFKQIAYVVFSRLQPPKIKELKESDGEFEPEDASSTDDEETIAQEETLDEVDGKKKSEREKEEIDALKRESEIPLEDLLDDLPPGYLESLGQADSFSTNADEVSSIRFFSI